GAAFAKNRLIGIAFLVLPVIGLLERYGLQERAKTLIARLRGLTAGRLLLFYFLIRQVAAAFGVPFGGQAQVVRPLLAPMVEGAAETQAGRVSTARRYWLRAHAAAAENIGLFFAEDVFVAMSSVVLIQASLATFHVQTELLHLSLWAIPTAILAAAVHGTRLLLVDRVLKRDAAANVAREP
ncbi:MAG: DUF969 domain-containing protein, partial [Alphaproteobacteria bacterium]|nr:DUF969 domain-containing protein [Alphaproteobacteria bacterium]